MKYRNRQNEYAKTEKSILLKTLNMGPFIKLLILNDYRFLSLRLQCIFRIFCLSRGRLPHPRLTFRIDLLSMMPLLAHDLSLL